MTIYESWIVDRGSWRRVTPAAERRKMLCNRKTLHHATGGAVPPSSPAAPLTKGDR